MNIMNTGNKRGVVAAIALLLSMTLAHAGPEATRIDEGEAARSAIARAGVGKVMAVRLVGDASRPLYRVMVINDADRFDIEVDAANGEVVKYVARKINEAKTWPRGMAGRESILNPGEVRTAAIAAAGGGVVVGIGRRTPPSGIKLFDFEIIRDGSLYTVEIDANSGEIMRLTESGFAPLIPAVPAK